MNRAHTARRRRVPPCRVTRHSSPPAPTRDCGQSRAPTACPRFLSSTVRLESSLGSELRGTPSRAVTREPQQQALRAPDEEGIDVLHARLAAFAARQLVEQRLECDARFQPRQRRTEAEVVAEAERQVSLRIAGDGELCRGRSEEHTSELQSLRQLVCRLLPEKK